MKSRVLSYSLIRSSARRYVCNADTCNQNTNARYRPIPLSSFLFPSSPTASATRGSLDDGCEECGLGQFQSEPGKTLCLGCPAGWYGGTIGQASSDDGCAPCVKGKYSSAVSATDADQCNSCAAGRYGDESSQKTAAKGCKFCVAGKYQNAEAATSCIDCEGGSASESGAVTCGDCFEGKKLSATKCENCPAGRYSESRSAECKLCPAGSTSKAGSPNCAACPPGTARAEGATTTECTDCSAGQYSTSMSGECTDCPAGQTSTSGDPICTNCPPGKHRGASSSSVVPGATGATDASDSGGATGTACVDCSAGQWSGIKAAACKPCALGKTSKPGESCAACPPGTWRGWVGTTPPTANCTACKEGRYSAAEAANCTACERGKSLGTPGGQMRCPLCEAGSFQGDTGGLACVACAAGKTSYDGWSECRDCRVGEVAAEAGSKTCTKCNLTLGETTLGEGQTSCVCGEGLFEARSSSAVAVGSGGGRRCIKCSSSSMDCSSKGNTLADLVVKEGYWRPFNKTATVLPCPIPGACQFDNATNSSCRVGHTGVLCAICATNYSRFSANSLCELCAATDVSIALSIVVVVLVGAGLFAFLHFSRGGASGSFRPIINGVQTMSVVLMTTNRWPTFVTFVRSYVFQSLNLEVIRCVYSPGITREREA